MIFKDCGTVDMARRLVAELRHQGMRAQFKGNQVRVAESQEDEARMTYECLSARQEWHVADKAQEAKP